MHIQIFTLNVISNEEKKKKKLIHHKIIHRIAEQIETVFTQVCKESKLWIHSNLR